METFPSLIRPLGLLSHFCSALRAHTVGTVLQYISLCICLCYVNFKYMYVLTLFAFCLCVLLSLSKALLLDTNIFVKRTQL